MWVIKGEALKDILNKKTEVTMEVSIQIFVIGIKDKVQTENIIKIKLYTYYDN